ncbi:hypothetical protein G6011_03299 [Alternaria panax]|uniref:Uncharacterized protein n=1 Tax=Alternaria panax TaxID=48097 RepID=A0AAD4IEV4_9PLEO|nr:hypothetical protein G6011_03299 [Alternaria panax]
MDCANLFIARVALSTGMIIVDPESAQALPYGMMHVQVELYMDAPMYSIALNSCWPTTLPKPQVLLVPVSNLRSFLDDFRKLELSHAVRVMPGKTFEDRPSHQKRIEAIGVYGLSIRIHVNPNYVAKFISASLEEFRRLHGPLNEVSIIGAPDEQQAHRIEASVTARRDAARDSKFLEA